MDSASLVVSYDDTKEGGYMNANIQIQKKGTYLIDICGFHLDYMKGPFSKLCQQTEFQSLK